MRADMTDGASESKARGVRLPVVVEFYDPAANRDTAPRANWVPATAWALPTGDRGQRLGEFADLFARGIGRSRYRR